LEIVKISQAIIMLVFGIIVYYLISLAKEGRLAKLRRVPALDAIEEIVKRADELGGEVHFTTGAGERTGLYGVGAAQLLAGIDVLTYVAPLTTTMDIPLSCSTGNSELIPMMQEIVRQAHRVEGKEAAFNPLSVQFWSDNQFTHAAALMGYMERENISSLFLIGPLWAQTLLICETAASVGAVQLGGTAYTHQLAMVLAACDYCLIGEEIFAAGAYLSQEPIQLATIQAEDMMRLIIIALILIGAVLVNLNISWLADVLKL
jgi:hypothetical protein